MHANVGEQRTDDTTVRRPPRARLSTAHVSHPLVVSLLVGRVQSHLEQVPEMPVHHSAGHALQPLLVRNRVAILRQGRVDHVRVSVAQRAVDRSNRIRRAPIRSIAICTVVTIRFADGLHHPLDDCLYHQVQNRT